MPSPNGRPAYVAVARKVFEDDPFWSEPRTFSRWEAWVDLIQMAQWKAREWAAGCAAVQLQRGETRPLSRSWLAGRWGWGEKAVRGYLVGLQQMGRIRASQRTPQGPTYLLVNYDTYQGGGPAEGQPGASEGPGEGPGEGTPKGQARAPQRATDRNMNHHTPGIGEEEEAPNGASSVGTRVTVATQAPIQRARSYEEIQAHLSTVLSEVAEGTRARRRVAEMRELQAELVFAYWQAKTGHEQALLDDKRLNRLKRALRENRGDVHELLYAIDGWRKDPTFRGLAEKENRVLDGIENIFTDRGRIERLAGHCKGRREGKPHGMAMKYLEAAGGNGAENG